MVTKLSPLVWKHLLIDQPRPAASLLRLVAECSISLDTAASIIRGETRVTEVQAGAHAAGRELSRESSV